MDNKDKIIQEQREEIFLLNEEIKCLQLLLSQAGIPYGKGIQEKERPAAQQKDSVMSETETVREQFIIPETITQKHAQYFYSFFKGRKDVYSKRAGKPNPKTGKTGYYTQCWNYWKPGICPKYEKKKIKCADCPEQHYKELTGKVIMQHLTGAREDCSDVIGVYPMLPDETCNFLVFDFDNHDDTTNGDDYANTDELWREEVNALREICRIYGVDILTERSRSGKGAHIWMFFQEPVPARTARLFGTALLTKGAESVNQKSFRTYDRMLPAQDHMPVGGLGNLIALPLQGQALKKGNSAFIDQDWNVYPNQWQQLQNVKKLSKEFIDKKINEWAEDGVLGALSDLENMDKEENGEVSEDNAENLQKAALNGHSQQIASQKSGKKSKPWKKKKLQFYSEDVSGQVHLVLANGIYVEKENLQPRLQNTLRRMAAYSNPQYYKNHAMGFSNRDNPRIVACFEEFDDYISIPRGLREILSEKLKQAEIPYEVSDERQKGKSICVDFSAELYPEQRKASEQMLRYENGILHAATAFGKTAVGAYLIAARKTNTLILVHNKEIMNNWVEDIQKFLDINEEPPEYTTPKGRVKRRKSVIGTRYAGHDSMTGIIDVVMISSLGKPGNIDTVVKDYGMVLIDECHHCASDTAEAVVKEVSARYVYGLTATPKRDDGQEQKIFMQIGPVRYRFSAKDKVKLQGIAHYVYPRFTRLINTTGQEWKINEAYAAVRGSDVRNRQIISDVEECLRQGRTPLVLTKFRDHADILLAMLRDKADHVFLLKGGRSRKENEQIRENMKNVPANESMVLVAIGQYIGEGFNYPRLDTMMLTTPIAWQGNVEQYSGRLHRDYEGKRKVIIYDYVDAHIRVLDKMYYKRLRAYKKIGYEIVMNEAEKKQETNAIFDSESYTSVFERDVAQADTEIVISSPGIGAKGVHRILKTLEERHDSGVKITLLTLSADNYPQQRIEKTKGLITELIESGVTVLEKTGMHEHFAVIDREIVWYGSVNLLSNAKEEDGLMRVKSREIAQELLEIGFLE